MWLLFRFLLLPELWMKRLRLVGLFPAVLVESIKCLHELRVICIPEHIKVRESIMERDI